jgi:hypothetical protein
MLQECYPIRPGGNIESGARQGAKRSKLGQLAGICSAVWRRFAASFLQRIGDSGHQAAWTRSAIGSEETPWRATAPAVASLRN